MILLDFFPVSTPKWGMGTRHHKIGPCCAGIRAHTGLDHTAVGASSWLQTGAHRRDIERGRNCARIRRSKRRFGDSRSAPSTNPYNTDCGIELGLVGSGWRAYTARTCSIALAGGGHLRKGAPRRGALSFSLSAAVRLKACAASRRRAATTLFR